MVLGSGIQTNDRDNMEVSNMLRLSVVFVLLFFSGIACADGATEDCGGLAQAPKTENYYRDLIACARRVSDKNKALREEQLEIENAKYNKKVYENSPSHSSMSYQRCVIKKMPGAGNDMAAKILASECAKYSVYAREKKADLIFGFDTSSECFDEVGVEAKSAIASRLILGACNDLYP